MFSKDKIKHYGAGDARLEALSTSKQVELYYSEILELQRIGYLRKTILLHLKEDLGIVIEPHHLSQILMRIKKRRVISVPTIIPPTPMLKSQAAAPISPVESNQQKPREFVLPERKARKTFEWDPHDDVAARYSDENFNQLK